MGVRQLSVQPSRQGSAEHSSKNSSSPSRREQVAAQICALAQAEANGHTEPLPPPAIRSGGAQTEQTRSASGLSPQNNSSLSTPPSRTHAPSAAGDLLRSQLVLQDLIDRAFAPLLHSSTSSSSHLSQSPSPYDGQSPIADPEQPFSHAAYPPDSPELDYLLDLLLCNSVVPLKQKPRRDNDEGDEDSESDVSSDESDVEEGEGDGLVSPDEAQPTGGLAQVEEEEDSDALSSSIPITSSPKHNESNGNGNGNHQQTVNGANGQTIVVAQAQPKRLLNRASSSMRQKLHKEEMDPVAAANARYIFASTSPDEIALCESLDRCGLTLTERRGNTLTVRYTPRRVSPSDPPPLPYWFRFQVKATLDFTSTRARMDVVIQTPDGKYKFFVKGSDQQIMRMLHASLPNKDAESKEHTIVLMEKTGVQLGAFAKTGSRTLVMAGRTLSSTQYRQFQSAYEEAANSLEDREANVEKCFKQLEAAGLDLLGCSAVEDQLQQGVSEAIDFLLKGGLKVILLTGDRLETAVSIGHQSSLLQPHMRVLQIAASDNEENIYAMLQENVRIVTTTPPTDESAEAAAEARQKAIAEGVIAPPQGSSPQSTSSSSSTHPAPPLGYALAIDGSSLECCLTNFPAEFILLFLHCATIISYRSTPKQKSLAVQVVKDKLKKSTLAIGDGANDVSMIQEANVGVGILGKEGSHAALSSDFVIHRFKHLVPLVFLHGRYNYYRTAQVVFFSFYKNMVFPVPMILFSFYSYNSGQVLYAPLLMSAFNLAFTSLPPMVAGWYERDVNQYILLRRPDAYNEFKRHNLFRHSQFWLWMCEGVLHGGILWYVMWLALDGAEKDDLGSDTFEPDGDTADMYTLGMIVYTGVIIITNIKMTTALKYITTFNLLGALIGVAAYFLLFIILSFHFSISLAPESYGLLQEMFTSHLMWVYLLLCLGMCYLPSLAAEWVEIWHPNPIEKLVMEETRAMKHEQADDMAMTMRKQSEGEETAAGAKTQIHIDVMDLTNGLSSANQHASKGELRNRGGSSKLKNMESSINGPA